MLDGVKIVAVIAAGGTGSRFGVHGGKHAGKQLLEVAGRPLAAWAVEAFVVTPCVDEVVVVCDPARVEEFEAAIRVWVDTDTVALRFVAGGTTRTDSVQNGLDAIIDSDAPDDAIVLIHDGARPLILPSTIQAAYTTLVAANVDGVVVGHPLTDTIKQVDGQTIIDTPDRTLYWAAQTPQAFRFGRLLMAYERATARNIVATDDAALMEADGATVIMVEGSRDNIKVTRPEDAAIAEAALLARLRENGTQQ